MQPNTFQGENGAFGVLIRAPLWATHVLARGLGATGATGEIWHYSTTPAHVSWCCSVYR